MRSGNRRNCLVIALLVLLPAAELVTHLAHHGRVALAPWLGVQLGLTPGGLQRCRPFVFSGSSPGDTIWLGKTRIKIGSDWRRVRSLRARKPCPQGWAPAVKSTQDNHRDFGVSQYLRCLASQHQGREPASSMRRHANRIAAIGFRGHDDLLPYVFAGE